MAGSYRVVAFSGSLRRGSYNSAALRAAQKLAPAGMSIEIISLEGVPLYNEDVKQVGFPPAVNDLRSAVRGADGLLLSTPEYNHSFSGVIKNAVDWISRPPDQPFQDKPLAIMSASPGFTGGVRAYVALRQCFGYLDAKILNTPEVLIAQANQRFDEAGDLTDEATRQIIGSMLANFAGWIERIRSSRQ
jgi:chromate reductase, NAD(P)H dehydrogenase (quinone)